VAILRKRFLSGFIFLAVSAFTQTPKPVDAVISDYVRAVGGLSAVDAINSRKVTASAGLLGKSELYWQKPNKVLLLSGKDRIGFDGSAGWHYSKRKRLTRLMQGQQMPLEIDGNPLRYVHLRQLYPEIKPEPQKTVDGILMDVLSAPNDLAQTVFYFDSSTHLLLRLDEKGDTSAYSTHIVWFEDYKPVEGVQFPFRITHKTSDDRDPSEEFRVKSVENNVPVDAESFSKPQSTKLVFGGKR
jgi:hypothetical protein